MKILLSFLLLFIADFAAQAQDHQQLIYSSPDRSIILIANEEIIGSLEILKSVPANDIMELNIYENKKFSTEYLFYDNEKIGIANAQVDFDFATKTQKELNEFFGIDSENDVYVNGFLVQNKNHKISLKSISRIEVIESNNFFTKKDVLNIILK